MVDQITLAIYVTASLPHENMKYILQFNFNTSMIYLNIYFSSKADRYLRNSNLIMMLNHETWVPEMTTTK